MINLITSALLLGVLGTITKDVFERMAPQLTDHLVRRSARRRHPDDPDGAAAWSKQRAAEISQLGTSLKLVVALGFAFRTAGRLDFRPVPSTWRYLLPSERRAIEVRRHWALFAEPTLQSCCLAVIGLILTRLTWGSGMLHAWAVYFTVLVIARWSWITTDWWGEKLVLTDKRFMLITGIARRKVAMMPLVAIVDFRCPQSRVGKILGYGELVVESVDQALSRVPYIPKPEELCIRMSERLVRNPPEPSAADLEVEMERAGST